MKNEIIENQLDTVLELYSWPDFEDLPVCLVSISALLGVDTIDAMALISAAIQIKLARADQIPSSDGKVRLH